jgi:hypothetical protein
MDNETAGSTTRPTGSLAAPRPALPASLLALHLVQKLPLPSGMGHGRRAPRSHVRAQHIRPG